MIKYNVHIYREMRLTFEDIAADSSEAAAQLAREKPTDDAVSMEDCDGETLAALVDVSGDEEYEQSRLIAFEGERFMRTAHSMLASLQAFVEADRLAEECGEWKWETLEPAFQQAREVIAAATGQNQEEIGV